MLICEGKVVTLFQITIGWEWIACMMHGYGVCLQLNLMPESGDPAYCKFKPNHLRPIPYIFGRDAALVDLLALQLQGK